jgi:hypothetical protein
MESRSFVGSQQAGTGTAIRSAVAAANSSRDVVTDANRPFRRAAPNRPYDARLAIGFDYIAPPIEDVEQRITDHLRVLPASLEVSVDGRTATLRGEVASRTVRDLAEILTRFQPGISAVQNELQVAHGRADDPPVPRRGD